MFLDGTLLGEVTIGSSPQTYSFNAAVSLNSAHDVQIQYLNNAVVNGQDRNLTLNSIGINGQTISATSPYEVYHAQAGGQGDLASDGNMYWSPSSS